MEALQAVGGCASMSKKKRLEGYILRNEANQNCHIMHCEIVDGEGVRKNDGRFYALDSFGFVRPCGAVLGADWRRF